MLRNLFRFVALLVVIAVVRYLVATVWRAVAGKTGGSTPGVPKQTDRARSAGELRKDPVCGTFVSAASSVTKQVDGELVHFCSAACRDKFRAA